MSAVRERISSRRRASGYLLIENLIAMVILSIGVLGIITLLTVSKTSQHQAIQRARAVSLADAIVERIRINPAAVQTYNIGLNPVGDAPETAEPNPDCRTSACNPDELAAHDLWLWEQALAGTTVTADGDNLAGLIEPRGCVVFTPATPKVRTGLVNVIIQWRGLEETYDAVQGSEVVCGGAASGSDNFRRKVIANTFVIDEMEI